MAKTKSVRENMFAEKLAARKGKMKEARSSVFDDVELEDGMRDDFGVGDYDDEEDEEFLASYGLTLNDVDDIDEQGFRKDSYDDDDDDYNSFADDDEEFDLQAEEDRYFEALSKKEKRLVEALEAVRAKKRALREMNLGFMVQLVGGKTVDKNGKPSKSPATYDTKKEAQAAADKFTQDNNKEYEVVKSDNADM